MATVSRWCRYCGAENKLDATFCRSCGRRFVVPNQRQQVPRQPQQNVVSQQREVYGTRRTTTMNAYIFFWMSLTFSDGKYVTSIILKSKV